ncbi:dihydropteroate synthase [soil metagenome]
MAGAAGRSGERRHALEWRRAAVGAERRGTIWRRTWTATLVMGIVNVTPDSFSDGGTSLRRDDAVGAARAAWRAGAHVVDVGGASTRPGAEDVPVAVEADRVVGVVRDLAADAGGLISIDTTSPEVAVAALEAGADVVNDVTGLRDPDMRTVVAAAGVPAVVMHMQGSPRTMQHDPRYHDVVAEVGAWLRDAAEAADEAGVSSVLLDPGFGFGKLPEHNRALLLATPALAALGRPVLVGASRKGTLGVVTGEVVPEHRDPASLAVHLEAARLGAAMVRVHDVAAHVQALAVRRWIDG